MGAVRIAALRRSALWLVTVVLITAGAGCSTERVERKSAGTPRGGDSSATASTTVKSGAEAGAARHDASQAGPTNRVRLIDHGCVQFEPRWSTVRVGQSLAWHSELKSSVTVHVSPGAFDKTEYVVRPGAIVSTGPARVAGSYSMWSVPAACQSIPLGVRGAGPGVMVEDSGPR